MNPSGSVDWFAEAERLRKLCKLQHNALLRVKADLTMPDYPGEMDAGEQMAIECMNEAIEEGSKEAF